MNLDALEKRFGRREEGGRRVGEWHGRARHSDALVELVREWYQAGVQGRGMRATAEHFDLPFSTVRDFVKERTRTL